jgi:hypothetical protein
MINVLLSFQYEFLSKIYSISLQKFRNMCVEILPGFIFPIPIIPISKCQEV